MTGASWHATDIPTSAESVTTYVPDDGSDLVLFDSVTGGLHRMPGTSATVWAAIDGLRSVAAVIDTVSAAYDADPTVVGPDVIALLDQLTHLGLIARR
jgi:hypothetical protein